MLPLRMWGAWQLTPPAWAHAGPLNPMRPHRVRLTHKLVESYGMTGQLKVHRPLPRSFEQITEFHADGELPDALIMPLRGSTGKHHSGYGPTVTGAVSAIEDWERLRPVRARAVASMSAVAIVTS